MDNLSQSIFQYAVVLLFAFTGSAQAQSPAVRQVLNSATVSTGPVAPGLLASIVGTDLAGTALQFCVTNNNAAPLSCNGVAVLVNGKPAPLFQTLATVIAFEVPADVTGPSASLQVTRQTAGQTLQSAPFNVPVAPVAPGLYTHIDNGVIVGSFINQSEVFVSASTPARPGDALSIQGTGFGATNPVLLSGSPTPDTPRYSVVAPVTMTIGGKPATVGFAGLWPQEIGVDQLSFTVPQGLDGGNNPVVVTVGGVSSPPVSLPIAGAKVTVTGVSNSASGSPGIESGSWATIYGTNLSATSRTWQVSDFKGNNLPTALDGVSVTINGKSAAVYYINPSQLNVLAPADTATGPVQVQVTNSYGSATGTATLQQYAPGFFTFQGGKYPAAVHTDGVYVAPPGFFGSVPASRPAQPGETILIFGTGFGPTTPAAPAGQMVSAPAPLSDPAQLHINVGGVPAAVLFAGITAAGEYQFNVVMPTLAGGDQPVDANIAGVSIAPGLSIPIKN